VDGMPAECVLGRGGRPPPVELVAAMPFTHSLLASGKGLGYHARAAPPTVTMPRLKVNMRAMTCFVLLCYWE
jgi:ethanolaminephosphotransferase